MQVAFATAQPDVARQLIRYGADIEYLSARGWSVISYLWEYGRLCRNNIEFYEMCSAQEFTAFDAQDGAGWTCLHRAAAYGTGADIETLLRLGASTSLCTKGHGWSPIHVAAALDNLSALKALSKRASRGFLHSPDANGWTPLHIAVERGAEQTMRYLLEHGADPHASSNITAMWFPPGLEHNVLTPEDLARDRGSEYLEKYVTALQDANWDIVVHDEEVFWESEDVFEKDFQSLKTVLKTQNSSGT